MQGIGVRFDKGPVDISVIEGFERRMGVAFPRSYKELIAAHNNLYPEKPEFAFVGPWGTPESRSIRFWGYGNVYERIDEGQPCLIDPDDGEVQGVIAIGDDGGGDEICFDYRDCPGTDDPAVVFLYHDLWWPDEAGEWRRVIWPIAPSFDAFLEMLHEEEVDMEKEGDEGGV